MSYTPELQARINAKAAENRNGSGPSFPMPRLRHNGETGKWSIREVEGDKLADETTDFKELDNNRWEGVILRTAYMSQTKYKPNSPFTKKTREFTDFKNEPIEVLKQTFGENGKTESVKVFPDYQSFKAGTAMKDEDGNDMGSTFELKVVVYVYHLKRKEVIKFVFGGSARSEWFEYTRKKRSGDEGVISSPWCLHQPSAQLLEQIKTIFISTPAKTEKGLEYHRVSFLASDLLKEKDLKEVFEVQDKVNEWVKAWEKVNAKPEHETVYSDLAAAGLINGHEASKDDFLKDIRTEDIPF